MKILVFLFSFLIAAFLIYVALQDGSPVEKQGLPGKYILDGDQVGSADTLIVGRDGYYQIINRNNEITKQGKWRETVQGYYGLANYMDVKPYRNLFQEVRIPLSYPHYSTFGPSLYFRKISNDSL